LRLTLDPAEDVTRREIGLFNEFWPFLSIIFTFVAKPHAGMCACVLVLSVGQDLVSFL